MSEATRLPGTDPRAIVRAAAMLRDGGVLAVPTDTFYGLAASIYQTAAVARVFEIKQRPVDRQVPLLLSSAADLALVATDIPRVTWRIVEAFWPGQLTIVLPVHRSAPDWLVAAGPTVGLRVPASRTCLDLLAALGEPLVGTSANLSGRQPCRRADEALGQIGEVIDGIVVDDDASTVPAPSTVLELTASDAVLHRQGAVAADRIREVLGPRTVLEEAV